MSRSESTEPAASERTPLTRQAIVAAAVELADGEGVAKLTMRNLAASLGYEVMSLYNHVANKNELLGLMVEAIADEIEGPDDDLEPLKAVRAYAVSSRTVLAAHPWAIDLLIQHLPGPIRIRQLEGLLRVLDASGLPPELAHHGFHAVNNHVMGYTQQERDIQGVLDDPDVTTEDFIRLLTPEEHPLMLAHIAYHQDGHATSSFELVLDLILDGLVRVAAEAEPG